MRTLIDNAINAGEGVLLMVPNWVPRNFNRPGRRLRLHPDDYLAFGPHRGYIEERWFCATAKAETGPLAPEDEGMSYVCSGGEKVLFKYVLEQLKASLIGQELMGRYGTWPMFSKFYDYQYPSFHHLHHKQDAADCVGKMSKPEAYYFPPQMNLGNVGTPYTFFGFDPSVTKEEIMERLKKFRTGDNRLTELSRAFRLELGTGWYTPAGVLHACGSLCTYEPQWNSDVFSAWENCPSGEVVDYSSFASSVPDDKEEDLEYIFSLMDWEVNTDPEYRKKYFRRPIVEVETEQYVQKWITYGNPYFGAKELTVYPKQRVTIKDNAAYGCILIQGFGKFGVYDAESPQVIRFGEQTMDEFFVSEEAAKKGVTIENHSREPFVMLKHFANNCGMPQAQY